MRLRSKHLGQKQAHDHNTYEKNMFHKSNRAQSYRIIQYQTLNFIMISHNMQLFLSDISG
jgi:hypothetical protein